MSMEIFITFIITATIVLIIPGPTIILVIGQAMHYGRRSVIPLSAGVVAGDFTAMILSLLGLGAVLSASAVLFSVLKCIGAGYLFYLGFRMWRSGHGHPEAIPRIAPASGRVMFKNAFIVTALNPKSIAFFVAFLPQFVNPAVPAPPQFFVLGATFLTIAGINAVGYAVFAGQLRDAIQNGRCLKWFDRIGGSALISAGIFTAAVQRSAP